MHTMNTKTRLFKKRMYLSRGEVREVMEYTDLPVPPGVF